MEYTIEELRSMSNDDLRSHWQFSNYPFEKADCGQCLTMHNSDSPACATPIAHRNLRQAMDELGIHGTILDQNAADIVRQNLEEFFTLRSKFANDYTDGSSGGLEIEIADREMRDGWEGFSRSQVLAAA